MQLQHRKIQQLYLELQNEVLVEKTLEINCMLETMTEEEKELLPTLKEDLADIDAKWILATAMFSIEA